jgi:diadenosine tetraphosphate (Ap4A) HIT family hydrolase
VNRVDLQGGWFLKAHAAPCPVAGWCILELARPAATLDALAEDEARWMGVHTTRISRAIRRVTGCERVYLLSFAEVHRQVHLHLVPRHGEDARTAGWSLADHYREVQRGSSPAADAMESERAFAGIAKALDTA